jgi:sporulation protein YlmC with PRC-barrel domain
MKSSRLVDQLVVSSNGFAVGKVKDIIVDPEEWKVTHLEVELTKEASEQILGVKPALFDLPRNILAISALEKGDGFSTEHGIGLKVTKDQLSVYLRPLPRL